MSLFFLPGLCLAYLLGTIPSGFLITKWVRGTDIRQHGSGNIGTTNVFRIVGKKWGLCVFLMDLAKGFLAVTLLGKLCLPLNNSQFYGAALFGLMAIGGHTWPLWLGFKGGKGVATSLGVFLALTPEAAGAAFAVWAAILAWKRYVSLASLSAAFIFPVWVVVFYRSQSYFLFLFVLSLLLVIFVVFTHRENLKRLRMGTEKKII